MLAGRFLRATLARRTTFKLLAQFSKIKLDSSTTNLPKIEDMELHEETKNILIERGFTELFPVQYATYQDVASGMDIIARDKTGSGKTLAYALPLTERLREKRAENPQSTRKPKVLVLLPTRELALQVSSEFEKLSHSVSDHITGAFYGGVSYGAQCRVAKLGFDILVATPGRLQDHITRKSIDLSEIETVVLDETDEMLEIGFKDAIFTILQHIRDQAQNRKLQYLLFSATLPKWVKETAKEFLSKDHKFVDMVKSEDIHTPKNIKHIMYKVDYESEILDNLNTIVDTYAGMEGKSIIFTNTKREADNIVKSRLIRASARALHGDVSQSERESIFNQFRDGDLQCLVATNVAARGVDFPKVDLIVQVKPPNDVESFVHRSGRTGRAGKDGTCVLIYDQSSTILVRQLQREAKIKFTSLSTSELGSLKVKAGDNFRRYVTKGISNITDEQMDEGKELVDELVEKYGEMDALKRLVAYICLNPLERTNLRPKSKYSQGEDTRGDSRDDSRGFIRENSRGNMREDSRGSMREDSRGARDYRDSRENSVYGQSERPAQYSQRVPTDLTKSIFIGGISSDDQVEFMLDQLKQKEIEITLDAVKLPSQNAGKLGFAFATPHSPTDYTKLLSLQKIQFETSYIRFSSRS